MTGLLFVIFVIAPLQHCVVHPQPFNNEPRNKVADATELKNKVADAHNNNNNNNVLHLADELTKNCHAHLDRSYFYTCNRPFGQPPGPDVEDSVWDFDFQLPICVALYDASLRICNSTNQNIKYLAFNSTVLQSSLQQDERYGSKMICENMRTALVESPFEKTKDWMIVFKKKMSEDGACEHKCLSVKGNKVNPLCMVILWVHIVTRDFQNQSTVSTMEDDNPTGIPDDSYYSQIHGSDQADSFYNTYIPSAPPLSENVLPSGNSGLNLASNTDADPDFQYDANNEDNVEQNKKNSPPNIDSAEKVPDNPISHRLSYLGRPMQSNQIKPAKAEKHGKIGELAKKNSFRPNLEHQAVNNLVNLKQNGSSIGLSKIKPDGNTEVNIESDGKSSDNKKPDAGLTKSGKSSDNKKLDAGLTKSDGITVSQSSQTTNKETSNTDVKKEISNIDVSSVSPVSGQLEKNGASIMKNEMKSNTTPLSSETLKIVTHLPDKSIVSTVNNTAVTANASNSKLLVHENTNSSVTNTSLNKQMLNSGKNVSGKITDAPIEKDDIKSQTNDIKSQTSVPPTRMETSEKDDVEQEENQNEDKYGANSPGFGEDEDVGGDGGEGEDGDVGTGGGDEDDDDINIVADSEINQQTATNENVIVTSKFVDAEGSPFFAYFMTMVVICIIGYLVFHNKQKIMALALEGRSRRGSRRRPNTAGYRKLDSNLEEAVTSACSTSVTHVIY